MGKKKNDTSVKTNAMRIVESAKVPFRTKEYEVDEEDLSRSSRGTDDRDGVRTGI